MEKIFCNQCKSDKSLEEVSKNYNLCPDCKFDLSAGIISEETEEVSSVEESEEIDSEQLKDLIEGGEDEKKKETNDLEREMYLDKLERGGGILKKISGYFQFKNMITTYIIKNLYVLGVIAIIIYSIELINRSSGYGANEDLKLYGFALLIFGNLFWRLICEGWILFFSIHESLVSIENNTKNN